MRILGKTSIWKGKTNQKSINLCLHNGLIIELDYIKRTTGTSRSEIIRSAIRQYIKVMRNQLVEAEKEELLLYQSHRPGNDAQPEYWIKA